MAEPHERGRFRRLWDITLLLSVATVVTLGAWLLLERGAPPATTAAAATGATSNPAIALKREAGQLWAKGERTTALARWEEAYRLAPDNPSIVEDLAHAQVAVAGDLLHSGEPDDALPLLEAAYTLKPDEKAVLYEYQALLAYLAGRDAVASGEWAFAIETLSPLYQLDSGYLDVHSLLETALAGEQQLQALQVAQSEKAASQARTSIPGERVASLLRPLQPGSQPGQTELPALGLLAPKGDKHIVVSINRQRMYVYEGDKLIWEWVASTGESARPTVPGHYRIQSKFENARSNVWSLWMPYWQGIYWAGSVENGIHGQVTFDSGGRLWEGYLGTRITYGCVMISDTNAATLFDWTEMGTPVSIHWDWDPAWVPDENGNPM